METDHLIAKLSAGAERVQRLPRPSSCLAIWLGVSVPYIALVVLLMSPRTDLGARLFDALFVIQQLAALATGVLSAIAAFASIVPGASWRFILLPAASWALWLAAVGIGCLKELADAGFSGLTFTIDFVCLPATAVVGLVPAAAMAFLLRRGAPLHPYRSAFLGGLAAAGLGNFGLRLFHAQDAGLMVLVWQLGSVILLTAAFGSAGPRLLSWARVNREARARLGV